MGLIYAPIYVPRDFTFPEMPRLARYCPRLLDSVAFGLDASVFPLSHAGYFKLGRSEFEPSPHDSGNCELRQVPAFAFAASAFTL
jgi:hypothetical protein